MLKINCENRLCAFWEEGECIKKCVYLDAIGVCLDCVQVDVDEAGLPDKRRRIREALAGADKERA